MNYHAQLPTSSCCDAVTIETDMGICPQCLEHCEFTTTPYSTELYYNEIVSDMINEHKEHN
jgi:hypothetical protein